MHGPILKDYYNKKCGLDLTCSSHLPVLLPVHMLASSSMLMQKDNMFYFSHITPHSTVNLPTDSGLNPPDSSAVGLPIAPTYPAMNLPIDSAPPPLNTSHPLANTPLIPTSYEQLEKASKKQLQYWILEANKAATATGHHSLAKSGTKASLIKRLSNHYNLENASTATADASAPLPASAPVISSVDEHLLRVQRQYRNELAHEMLRASVEGKPFLLSTSHASMHSLPATPEDTFAGLDRAFGYLSVRNIYLSRYNSNKSYIDKSDS